MAESLGSAVLDLRADKGAFDRDIDGAKRKAESLDRTFVRIGGNMAAFGQKLTLGVTLPLAAAGAAAFKLASDAQEASNKFEIVMGGSADRVRVGLKELEAQIPLTTGELLNLAAGTQDLLVPMGLARDAGATMSLQFIELAGDISAFNNVPVAQVLADIKSGLVGSSEPLFKYGVDTRVAALETVALANGLIQEGEKLNDVARAQAVLLQIQAQSTDAMGAARREAEGAAQQMAFLFKEVRQLGEEIGMTLIPIFVPMIAGLRDSVTWFRNLTPEVQGLVVKAGLLAAAIGPVVFVIGKLLLVGGRVAGMMVVNTAATNAWSLSLAGKAGLVGAVALASVALGTFISNQLDAYNVGLDDVIGRSSNLREALAIWGDILGQDWLSAYREDVSLTTAELVTMNARTLEVSDESDRLAQILADELAAALGTVVTTSGDAAAALKEELLAAMADLGVAVPDVSGKLDAMNLLLEEGEVPVTILAPAIKRMVDEWVKLDLLSPALQAKVDALNESLRLQGVIIEQIIPPAGDFVAVGLDMNLFLKNAPAPANDFTIALRSLKEMYGLTEIQINAIITTTSDYNEQIELARGLTGKLGPRVQELANEMLGLDRETLNAKFSMEGATNEIDGFLGLLSSTGIGVVDSFVGKIKSVWGVFKDILGLVSGLTSKIGGFFDFLGKLGGGGKGGGLGGLLDIGKSLGGLLGIGGGAASVITTPAVGLAPGLFGLGGAGASAASTAGVATGTTFLGSVGATISGGMSSMMGALVPLMTNPITIGIAAAIGGAFLIKKLFFKSVEDIRSERQTSIFGAFQVPQSVSDGLGKLSKSFSDAGRALPDTIASIVGFDDVIKAVGINSVPQFSLAMNKGDEAVQRLKEGLITGGEAAEFFGTESLQIMKDAAVELGGDSVAAFDNMINKAVEAGIVIPDAFLAGNAAIVTSTSDTAARMVADFAAAEAQILSDASLSAADRAKQLQVLTAQHEAAMQTMMAGTVAAQNTIASAAIGAAQATGNAWVKSASTTVAAWAAARTATVGLSSIIDIQILGSEAAQKLGDDHADAARRTESEWERVNRDLAMDHAGGGGGDDERRRRERDRARDRGGDDRFRFDRDRGGGRGGGAANMTVNLFLSRSGRELLATDTVKLTMPILKKLGLV